MQVKKYLFFFISLGVLVLGVAAVSAVTTISTTISTAGDLYVGGKATTTAATGNIATDGTLAVTGASTLTGDVYVGGKATTTAASGNISTAGSLTVGTGGTAVTKMLCAATTTNWSAFSAASHCQWGTSTMTGLTATAEGGWAVFVSPVATTSGISTQNVGFSVMAYPTSTNVVEIKICDSSSTDTTDLPVQYYEVCAIKH
jgi:hypothetical protein